MFLALKERLPAPYLRLATQFTKFAIVGTTGTVVDFGVLNLLVILFQFNIYLANTFSFSAAVLNNFLLNRAWTFRELRGGNPAVQLVQFAIVSIGGYIINQAMMYLFIEHVHLWYNWAKAVATLVVLFWNFAGNRLWTFRGSSCASG